MYERLNYCSQAIEDLNTIKKSFRGLGWHVSDMLTEMLIEEIKKSTKFILPNSGQIYQTDGIKQKEIDLLYLPYSSISAEYSMEGCIDDTVLDKSLVCSLIPKRIAFAFDYRPEREKNPPLSDFTNYILGSRYNEIPEKLSDYKNGYIAIFPVNYSEDLKRWVPSWVGRIFPYGQTLGSVKDMPIGMQEYLSERDSRFFKSKTNTGSTYKFDLIEWGEYGAQANDKSLGDERLYMHGMYDTQHEFQAVLQLCAILNCGNVSQSTIPAPHKLNKKRLKSGKPPLFEYKILTVGQPVSKTGPSAGGCHASPRQHLRRGHIRRLQSGNTTWVQPCLVGESDAGVIKKDYKVI